MAALASSRQNPAATQQLTPPSSSHGAGGSWDFAVPLNNTTTSYDQEPYMSEYVTSAHAPRQPLTSQANGFAKPVRSTTWGSQDQFPENNRQNLVPDRVNELHKKASGDMSAGNGEQDGVQEYYKEKGRPTNKKGPPPAKAKAKKKPVKLSGPDPELDQNNWIHRDKLKEIETRELEEAGFRVPQASRSRSQSATRRSRDRTNSEATDTAQNEDERYEPRKVVSPIPAEEEELVEQYHAWSPTPPEDADLEPYPTSPRMTHTVRPSTSRIPLPKTSGTSIPATGVDGNVPQPRSRTGSTNWSGDANSDPRLRSGSVGSQALFDEPEDTRQRTPPHGHTRKPSATSSGSPPKSPQKQAGKAKPPGKTTTATARKPSVQKNQPKARTTSAASPPKRPGTSSGTPSRPTTSSRPEGEAPWIATMYKPDPRLPPDQQIIPTHAKRMQQEQWEHEGRVASMYDKDFRQLNNDDMADKRLSQARSVDIDAPHENEAWPLGASAKQPPSPEKIDRSTAKSPTEGGYKLTPNIPPGARAPSPKMAPPIAPAQPKPSTTRIQEPKEEAPEKKGCCCIVM